MSIEFWVLRLIVSSNTLGVRLLLRLRCVSTRVRALALTNIYNKTSISLPQENIQCDRLPVLAPYLNPSVKLILALNQTLRSSSKCEEVVRQITLFPTETSINFTQTNVTIPRRLRRLVLSRLHSRLITVESTFYDLVQHKHIFPKAEYLALSLYSIHDIVRLNEVFYLFPNIHELKLTVCCNNQENLDNLFSFLVNSVDQKEILRHLKSFTLTPNGCKEQYTEIHPLSQVLSKLGRLKSLEVKMTHADVVDCILQPSMKNLQSLSLAEITVSSLSYIGTSLRSISGRVVDQNDVFEYLPQLQKLETISFVLDSIQPAFQHISRLKKLKKLNIVCISKVSGVDFNKCLLKGLPLSLDYLRLSMSLPAEIFALLKFLKLSELHLVNESDKSGFYSSNLVDFLSCNPFLSCLSLTNFMCPLPSSTISRRIDLKSLVITHSIFASSLLRDVIRNASCLERLEMPSSPVFVNDELVKLIEQSRISSLFFDSYQDSEGESDRLFNVLENRVMRTIPFKTIRNRDGGIQI
ncbi:hypothetical protein P9112_009575 [Eukaryota sp. TZLM1-RC]